jgi:hypothetical protein
VSKPLAAADTGAGGDNGIDHNKNCLRFPYVSTFLRPRYLHPHPYTASTAPQYPAVVAHLSPRHETAP